MSATIALLPGTFDPLTLGHVDLAERSARMFPRVILSIASGHHKQPVFTLDERVDLARQALAHVSNIEIVSCDGLMVEFAKQLGANIIIRGVRHSSDIDYELQLARMNRAMDNNFETLFLAPKEGLSFISSTLIREIARLQGDVTPFVPSCVADALQQKFHTPKII
jgi:pantetheine-phosphate adenylyltransferase